jgi:MFS family permease
MSLRTATWLAWSLWALSLALTALSLLLLALMRLSHPDVPIFDHWLGSTLAAIAFSTVGAVIAPRTRSDNPIGWLFCVGGLLFAVTHFSAEYAIYTLLAAPGSLLPGGEAAAWLTSWLWVPQLGSVLLVVLLFPDGRLPSRGWRWFAWLSVLLVLVGALLSAFAPGLTIALGPINNPLAVESLPNDAYKSVERVMNALIFVAVISLIIRLRRARELERQQIKWFVYATVLTISGGILTYPVSEAIGSVWLKWISFVPFIVGVMFIPISMGIAILRYRLYDIDILINRTIVYGSLTLMLALVYFGSVSATQALFQALTSQERLPQLVVVTSTLVIAALFTPLRRRIQSFIDRSFYRRKYDARKTLEAFSATLRDETDLEALNNDLVGVVKETMQPEHVSLWLRPDPAQKGGSRHTLARDGR